MVFRSLQNLTEEWHKAKTYGEGVVQIIAEIFQI